MFMGVIVPYFAQPFVQRGCGVWSTQKAPRQGHSTFAAQSHGYGLVGVARRPLAPLPPSRQGRLRHAFKYAVFYLQIYSPSRNSGK